MEQNRKSRNKTVMIDKLYHTFVKIHRTLQHQE